VMVLAGDLLPWWLRAVPWTFVYPAVIVVVCVAVLRAVRRLRKRAAAADWRLCLACVYPLADDEGVCPECGRAYTIDGLKKDWLSR